jgi:GNS1/SUR4 family
LLAELSQVEFYVEIIYAQGINFTIKFAVYEPRPVDYGNSEEAILAVLYANIYFIYKCIDLLDTVRQIPRELVHFFIPKTLFTQVFIILKKNDRQLSFLHIYHHTSMIVLGYIGAKWLPGGPPSMLVVLNTFVHIAMYTYYLLLIFKPELRNSSWKKHLTQLQLVQFVSLTLYFVYSIYVDCGYPKNILWLCIIQGVVLFSLFANFYRITYLKKKTQ